LRKKMRRNAHDLIEKYAKQVGSIGAKQFKKSRKK